jgi:hypothetical protein
MRRLFIAYALPLLNRFSRCLWPATAATNVCASTVAFSALNASVKSRGMRGALNEPADRKRSKEKRCDHKL